MNAQPSLVRRLGMAKILGLTIGLIAFFVIPQLWPQESIWLRIGICLWYTTFGVFIGLAGIVNHHPMLEVPLPFWFRGIFFGGWLNLVLAFLMYEKLQALLAALGTSFTSPFWIISEGMVLGLAIDGICTWFGGEGRQLLTGPDA
jgi:hypothetical protein